MRYSASSINLFESCPHRFFRQKIMMDVEDLGGAAAARGREIHAQFEAAALGNADWPKEFPHVERWFKASIVSHPSIAVERRMALDADYEPCLFDSVDAHVRGIADLILWNGSSGAMTIVDYKTGRKREGPHVALQMKLYALMAMLHSDRVQSVTTDVYWVASGEHTVRWYDRSSLDDLKAYITTAIGRIEREVEFPRRKSGLCRGYCPVTDCPHNHPPRDHYDGPLLSFS